jgi:hypothetical protein
MTESYTKAGKAKGKTPWSVSDEALAIAVKKLNHRPRKCLTIRRPMKSFCKLSVVHLECEFTVRSPTVPASIPVGALVS